MCTSTDDCFCHEQVRQSPSPNCSNAQTSRSSAEIVSLGSCRLGVAKQDLLQRVAAETEAKRLERDHLFRRDVPEVDLGPEVLDGTRLRGLRRRLPAEVVEIDQVRKLSPETGAHL